MATAWLRQRLSNSEWSMVVVFVTAFMIPFLTGLFGISYAESSGLFIMIALSYLGYRLVLYRSYQYLQARRADAA